MKFKNLKLLSLISISFYIQPITSNASKLPKVLYGSSAFTLPKNVQEFVLSGFLLALKRNYTENEIKDFLIQDQRPGNSAMEASENIQDNLKLNPDAVFGFPSTH